MDDLRNEIGHLLELGASVHRESGGYTVMKDPEGNQFCVSGVGGVFLREVTEADLPIFFEF